jgi:hypothetical protein
MKALFDKQDVLSKDEVGIMTGAVRDVSTPSVNTV